MNIRALYEHVKTILLTCKQQGIVLSERKAKLCQQEISFLGLEIKAGQIKLQKHIIEHINKFPDKMEDKKMLQRFLGCLTYAEAYIYKLAELRKPLQVKLKENVRWTWTDNDTIYITKCKKQCKNLPNLYHPSKSDFMIIETDASNLFWGGILKARTKNGSEYLCRYASGTFNGPETRYHSNEKEYLAIKKTIKKFRAYIIDNEFLIRTDSKIFGYFLRTNIAEDYKQGRLLKWQQWFNYYQFQVEHIPGTRLRRLVFK